MEIIWFMYTGEIIVIVISLIIMIVFAGNARIYKNNPEYNVDYGKYIKSKKRAFVICKVLIVGALASMLFYTFYEQPIEKQKEAYKLYVFNLEKDIKKYEQIDSEMIGLIDAYGNKADYQRYRKKLEKFPEEIESVRFKYPSRDISFDKRKKIVEGINEIEEHRNSEIEVSKRLIEFLDEAIRCEEGRGNVSEATKILDDIIDYRSDNNYKLGKGWALITLAYFDDYGIYYKDGELLLKEQLSEDIKHNVDKSSNKEEKGKLPSKETLSKDNLIDDTSKQSNDNVSLGGISLNDTESEIRERLGNPISVTSKESSVNVLRYKDVEVYIKDNHVQMLISNSPNAQTARGIHEQSSIHDAVKAYGGAYETSKYENYDLIEYKVNNAKIGECIIRFASEKNNNKINYISIRRADS